ncbi:NAD-dependent epimerase/dehydratase family protein [Parachryseolinea silvisoli]|uniref:NAD-dependent epimerase/dehydratase family protein n=1 Tax=Parachryseolinea silvisoli TaxID=2873601 RepID=UPI002265B592|nr:NAD(P)-dependent oxidoreductase [Parachryseolinea silvisoli]MCD9018782.1 NAD(P)-dependent oxidoreductase [Parachryseolinea silvisoli]
MKILVTGSAGHLGEALARTLQQLNRNVIGLDIKPSPYTTKVGSITDRAFVKRCLAGVTTIFHTATLHKPHVNTHSRQEFIDVNLTGTLTLLEESAAADVQQFIYTSTTSAFGDALVPPVGQPAAWITETIPSVPKNIYGVTKEAAENLCQLFWRNHKLPCIVLRTSRFFPEDDDDAAKRTAYSGDNAKANEFLFRRVEIGDAVQAHLLAAEKTREIGFSRYIISATSPFTMADLQELRNDAPAVVRRVAPTYVELYDHLGWKMFSEIDRVYVNEKARRELGWKPVYDFAYVLKQLEAGNELTSPLAKVIGVKGYHGHAAK